MKWHWSTVTHSMSLPPFHCVLKHTLVCFVLSEGFSLGVGNGCGMNLMPLQQQLLRDARTKGGWKSGGR